MWSAIARGGAARAAGSGPACRLCEVASGAVAAQPLVHAGARLVAFRSRDPRSAVHLLVAPREHLAQADASSLARDARGRELLREMVDLGEALLAATSQPKSSWRLMFHRWPFYSEPHLHMHVMAGDFAHVYRRLAHTTGTPWAVCARSLLADGPPSSIRRG